MGVRDGRSDVLRRDIIHAACEILLNEGYEKLSMRKIAKKIDYSPTTIYLYFKDKNELLFNIVEDFFAKFVNELKNVIEYSSGDSIKDLQQGLKAYIENGIKFPEFYKIIFINDLGKNINREQCIKKGSFNEQALQLLESSVAKCVEEGRFRDFDLKTTCQALWAAAHGLTSFFIVRPDFPWVAKDVLIDTLFDILINGLKR